DVVAAQALGVAQTWSADRVAAFSGADADATPLAITAIREMFEETGVLLAEGTEADRLAPAREALLTGTDFLEVVRALGSHLRPDWLVPYARWVTPSAEPRRFDTRFFLATPPPGQTAEHDARETTE